jgi:hypothetical protein
MRPLACGECAAICRMLRLGDHPADRRRSWLAV